jgi:hypothetical protein
MLILILGCCISGLKDSKDFPFEASDDGSSKIVSNPHICKIEKRGAVKFDFLSEKYKKQVCWCFAT